MPGDLCPGYPHVVALAPEAMAGGASELIANMIGRPGVSGLFTVESGCVPKLFRTKLGWIKAHLQHGFVLICCRTRRDRAEARRRLAAIAPAGFTVRD
jgi:hypothetical protein